MQKQHTAAAIDFAIAKVSANSGKRFGWSALLAGASVLAIAAATGAQAQTTNASGNQTQIAQAAPEPEVEEVTVTARRRSENIQNVPLVVDAITNEELNKLDIHNLTDLASVIPGLALATNPNGIGVLATLRGINFDVNSSGNNSTVQFYLNDQPITGNVVLQSEYDVGQIEVLRGPQGTLRGRASPSGSITVTTKLPDLDDWGGYLDTTATTLGEQDVNGAANYPIIPGKLAIRVAGLFDYNEGNRVHSISDPGVDPYNRTTSERVTVRFDPTEDIDIIGTVQNFNLNTQTFTQVESANFADPTQAASPVPITPSQRLAVQNAPAINQFYFEDYNLRGEWRFAGQKLNYVGTWTHEHFYSRAESDTGDFFNSGFPGSTTSPNNPFLTEFATTPSVKNYGLDTATVSFQKTQEVRLSSDDPLFGMVDYVVGMLIDQENDPVHLWQDTPIYLSQPVVAPQLPFLFEISNIEQVGHTLEKSVYGNVNVHIDDATEISGGVRFINFQSHSALTIQNGSKLTGPIGPPGPLGTPNAQNYWPVIYSGSLKHNFTDNIMAYVSTGTSWRANAETNPIIDRTDAFPWGTVQGLDHLAPERSTSYEAGVKTDWFDKELLANLTFYHQKFTNYFYSSPNVVVAARTALGPGGSTTGPNPGDTYSEAVFGPAAAVDVPATVNGLEGELAYQPLPNWNVGGTASYSFGKIVNGLIPCNSQASIQYQEGLITAPQFIAANGGQQVATCRVNVRAGVSSPFGAQIQSEYFHTVTDRFDGFIRGLVSIYGYSKNDPLNPLDAIPAYATLNLFGGVRDPDGVWALTFYGKNLFDTQRVINRDLTPLATSVQILATGLTEPTSYRAIQVTPQPEFGVNLHISLGSG